MAGLSFGRHASAGLLWRLFPLGALSELGAAIQSATRHTLRLFLFHFQLYSSFGPRFTSPVLPVPLHGFRCAPPKANAAIESKLVFVLVLNRIRASFPFAVSVELSLQRWRKTTIFAANHFSALTVTFW